MRRRCARTSRPRLFRVARQLGLAALGVTTLAPQVAHASPQFVAKIDESCPTLRAEVLVGHLEAETDADALDAQSPGEDVPGDPGTEAVTSGVWQIRVRCEPSMVQIQVVRPATGANARRFVPAPEAEDPQRERILALATLPLLGLARPEGYDATSPELAESPKPEGPPPVLPEQEPEPEPEPEPKPTPEPEAPPEPRDPSHELQLAGGAGFGTRLSPLPLAHMELRYVHWPSGHWGWGVSAGAQLGSLPVELGRVQSLHVPARVDAMWRSRSRRRDTRRGRAMRLHLSAALGFELAYARLRGVGSDTSIRGKDLGGTGGGPRMAVAGWLWPSPRVGLALELGAGWRVWAPVGQGQGADQGKEIATTRGPMASLALRLAFDLQPSP